MASRSLVTLWVVFAGRAGSVQDAVEVGVFAGVELTVSVPILGDGLEEQGGCAGAGIVACWAGDVVPREGERAARHIKGYGRTGLEVDDVGRVLGPAREGLARAALPRFEVGEID